MKFFVSGVFLIIGFLFSPSVQGETGSCPTYQIVSQLEEQPQEWIDWCTFAASRVITHHYGLSKSQCQLVGDVLGQSCCLGTVYDPACHPDPAKWPHDVFSKVGYIYSRLLYLVPSPTGPQSWADIVSEVCTNNRPLLAVASNASLPQPNWHAVVVEGYQEESTGELKVRVFDPQEDLCDPSNCMPENQNPRFLHYDYFFLSEVDHQTDYTKIRPKRQAFSDTIPPVFPKELKVN